MSTALHWGGEGFANREGCLMLGWCAPGVGSLVDQTSLGERIAASLIADCNHDTGPSG